MLKSIYIFISLILSFLISFHLSAADCSKPIMPSTQEWQQWLSDVKIEALNLGISKNTIESRIK